MFFLKHHYGPRFRVLHWCTDQLLNDALADMDLTSSQGRILGYLSHHAQAPCPRDLEEHFHLSHPSISGTLSRMEKKGFIEFRPDPADHRCKRIYILPKGMECHTRIEQNIDMNEARVVQDFTPEEQELFSQFLNRAITNLGGCPPCPPPDKKEEPKAND